MATLLASPATWRSLVNGEANIITESWAQRLRCVNKRDTHRIRSDEMHAVAALLGIAGIPVAHTPTNTQTEPVAEAADAG